MITRRTHRVRIADVAEAAGASKTAVSFAFNSPDRLSEETAARIREIADELGYRPDPVARMLTQGQTRAIGLLTPQPLAVVFSNPFFGALCEGVGMAADLEGYGLYLISPLHGSLARAVSRASVDGLVAIGLTAGHPEIEQVRRTGLPLVLVDSLAMPEHSSVTIDDEAGARAAADHLIALGHREFLAIAVEPPAPLVSASSDSITARRLAGYRSALSAARIGLPDEQVETEPATVAGGAAAFAGRGRGTPSHGRLAMSDAMAIGVIGRPTSAACDAGPQRHRASTMSTSRHRIPPPSPPSTSRCAWGGSRPASCLRRSNGAPTGASSSGWIPTSSSGRRRTGARENLGGDRGRDRVIADASGRAGTNARCHRAAHHAATGGTGRPRRPSVRRGTTASKWRRDKR